MIQQIVVLAGGLATRLHPITKDIPKSMVQLGNRPFIAYQLELFKKNGVEEAVLCVGYLHEQIQQYVGDGSRFGLRVLYSIEQDKLDTGGAIKNAYRLLDETFFVIYGDSYLTQNFRDVSDYFTHEKRSSLMTIYHNNNEIEPSRVLVEDKLVKKYQKDPPPVGAEYMEYGLNILPKTVINEVPETVFPISRFFDLLTERKELLSFVAKERFYEIGCHEGLATLEDKFQGGREKAD